MEEKVKVYMEEPQCVRATGALILYDAKSIYGEKSKEIVSYKINEQGEFVEPHAQNVRKMQDIFNAGNAHRTLNLMESKVLALNNTSIVWYEPNRIEPILFDVPEPERQDLNKLCKGKAVHWPTLIFKIHGTQLICFALKGTRRPNLKTKLYAAPLTHINSSDGWVCMPHNLRVDLHLSMLGNMRRISEEFYLGVFGHATGNNQANHPGGHDGLWREILTQNPRRFPDKYLKPTGKTLADLLK